MTPNPGRQPLETAGKRVIVRLAHGRLGSCDPKPETKPGWAADTTRWTKTGSPFDVAEFEVTA